MLPSAATRAARMFCVCLALLVAPTARAVTDGPGECAPPHTFVALLPLADRTDRTWELWSGESPARLVCRLFADSLERSRGRKVLCVPLETGPALTQTLTRAADDHPALRAARRADAEIAVTGIVSVFTHEDVRDAGRLARWGVGAPDARTRVSVSVTLRVLDARTGDVIIESTASRDRVGRGTAWVEQQGTVARNPTDDPLMNDVLCDVIGALVRTITQRLDASWQARVVMEGRDLFMLDAGASRGLFVGERLDVWRPGIQSFDEDMVRLGDATRVGAVEITALEGRGRARSRMLEGDVRMGDLVRPCSGSGGSAMSLRR